MSVAFDRQLKHTVTIRRATTGSLADDGSDYGHAARTFSDLAEVKALVQPERYRIGGGLPEDSASHYAGEAIRDFVIFMRATTVPTNQDVIFADSAGTYTGLTFEITQVREAAGQGHHLEIDCRLYTPSTVGE